MKVGALDELDLHILVDEHLDEERRASLQRRLAASPTDRARVEAWQGQNDLLRSTFAGIEREPLPAMLDLSPRARLQCIPANDAPLVSAAPNVETKSARRIRIAAFLGTLFVIAVGLGGSWLLLDNSHPDAVAAPTALLSPVSTLEGVARLPTTRIPDLSAFGFRFTGTETVSGPATLFFRYQNGSDRLAISASQASTRNDATSAPVWTGEGFGWRQGGTAFAISGTAKNDRLRAIAIALQKERSLE